MTTQKEVEFSYLISFKIFYGPQTITEIHSRHQHQTYTAAQDSSTNHSCIKFGENFSKPVGRKA